MKVDTTTVKILNVLTKNRRATSSSSSNQLTAQLLSDFLILFPKDFQNLVWGEKKKKQS